MLLVVGLPLLAKSQVNTLSIGSGKDFAKFDKEFACARSAQKFSRNLPVYSYDRTASKKF